MLFGQTDREQIKYVAESMIAGRFGHEGLCQLHAKLKKLQCETCYIRICCYVYMCYVVYIYAHVCVIAFMCVVVCAYTYIYYYFYTYTYQTSQ